MKNTSYAFLIILTIFSINLNAQNTSIEKPKICSTPPEGYLLGGKISLGPPISCLGVGSDSTLVSISNSSDPDIGGKLLSPIIYFNVIDNFDFSASKSVSLINNSISANFPFGKNWIMMVGEFNGKKYLTCALQENLRTKDPDYSATLCNDNKLTIKIPESKNNTYDRYTINWGNGEKEEINVSFNQLPIVKSKNTTDNQLVIIQGSYIRNNINVCSSRIAQVVPASIPTPKIIQRLTKSSDGTEITLTIPKELINDKYEITGGPQNSYKLWKTIGETSESSFVVKNLNPDSIYCFQTKETSGCGISYLSKNILCSATLSGKLDSNYNATLQFVKPSFVSNPKNLTLQKRNLDCLNCDNNIFVNPDNNTFYDLTLECLKEYEYTLRLNYLPISIIGTTYQISVLSNSIFINLKNLPKTIPSTYYGIASYDFDDGQKINVLLLPKSPNYEFRKFTIFKAEDKNSEFKNIANVPNNNFSDSVSNKYLTNQQCYKIQEIDRCGVKSELSNSFCTISLQELKDYKLSWSSLESDIKYENSKPFSYIIEAKLKNEEEFVYLIYTSENEFSLFDLKPQVDLLFGENFDFHDLEFRIIGEIPIKINGSENQKIFTYSNIVKADFITSISLLEKSNSAIISPNPAIHDINIKLNHPIIENVNLKINDQNGRIVFKKSTLGKEIIDNNIELKNLNLESGIYFLQISSKDYKETKKLIINK